MTKILIDVPEKTDSDVLDEIGDAVVREVQDRGQVTLSSAYGTMGVSAQVVE